MSLSTPDNAPKPHESKVCGVFHQSIELIGRRWTGVIIKVLMEKARRFSEFKDVIPELSDRLLAERLKELEEAGVLVREVAAQRPIQVSYRLTPKGRDLAPVLDAIGAWAYRWSAKDDTEAPEGCASA